MIAEQVRDDRFWLFVVDNLSSRIYLLLPKSFDFAQNGSSWSDCAIYNLTPLLSFGHPVLDLLHAHRVSLFALTCIPLNLLAIRTRFAPSVRKSALPLKGRGKMFLLTYSLPYLKILRALVP